MTVEQLVSRWREDAVVLRRRGATSRADLLELCVAELEQARRDTEAELITVSDAAVESGYSEAHIRRMIADGSVPNMGRPGAPRVCRGDLPRKPTTEASGPDLVGSLFRNNVA